MDLLEVTGCFPTGRGTGRALPEACASGAPRRDAGVHLLRVHQGSFQHLLPFSLLSRYVARGGQSSSERTIHFSFTLPTKYLWEPQGSWLAVGCSQPHQAQGLTQGWEQEPAQLILLCWFCPGASSSYADSLFGDLEVISPRWWVWKKKKKKSCNGFWDSF